MIAVENGVITVFASEAFEAELASSSCVLPAMPSMPTPSINGDSTYTVLAMPLLPAQACLTWKSYYSGGAGGSVERVEYGDPAKTDQVFTLLQDHLGGTNQMVNSSGTATQMRYGVWGAARDALSNLPTSRLYTGQEKSNTGLYYYNARWYDSELGRFAQPDTIIPDPFNPLMLDRFAYTNNNPLNINDPSGHSPVPPPSPNPYPIIGQAVEFFKSLGYSLVGDPSKKSIYANGADIVFRQLDKVGNVVETLCVECKDVANPVSLSTLGKNVAGTNYGGSINRVLSSAERLVNSSIDQLRFESNVILEGDKAGNLKNALFTTTKTVSQKAQDVFTYVYAAAANGAAATAKGAQTFITNSIGMPFLAVPYQLVDPKNSPWYNPEIPQ